MAVERPLDAERIVPGWGDPHARLVVVGEAPGEAEERRGRPFVGRSGKLLDRLLAEAGLERRRLWVTNAVKVRPTALQDGRTVNRAPSTAEINAWNETLFQEIARISPKAVLGLGAVAGKALLGKDFKLSAQRGLWLRDRRLGLPTLISWHPSYLLRRQAAGDGLAILQAIGDLEKISRYLAEP